MSKKVSKIVDISKVYIFCYAPVFLWWDSWEN